MTGKETYFLSPGVTTWPLFQGQRPRTRCLGWVAVGFLVLQRRFQGDHPLHVCWLSCGSEPVHVLPGHWGSLLPLPGDFPVVTLPSPWGVPGREWRATQRSLTEQVLPGPWKM